MFRVPSKFVILFEGRTGSTHLIELLRSHPHVRAKGEALASIEKKGGTAEDQLRWTHRALTASLFSPWRAVGFKTKLRDVLEPDGFFALLRQFSPLIIRMKRENVVKRIVSSFNARHIQEATGRWNLVKGQSQLPPLIVDIDEFEERFIECLAREARLDAFIDGLGLRVHVVEYDFLLRNQVAVLDELFAQLDLRPVPTTSKFTKATNDDLRKAVANYEELKARYVGTPFEWMFEPQPSGQRPLRSA
jgi:LPS sulfotransferase NodH